MGSTSFLWFLFGNMVLMHKFDGTLEKGKCNLMTQQQTIHRKQDTEQTNSKSICASFYI